MPELPEVEVTARSLLPYVQGQRITVLYCHDRRLRLPVPAGLEDLLAGQRVTEICRRAKYLLWQCQREDLCGTLILHLGMSGSLRVFAPGAERPPRRRHDHLEFLFENGACVRYHDPRRFGLCMWAHTPAEMANLTGHLGPEPLDDAFNAEMLAAALQRRFAPIKNALMDARLVVGIGNIYASEALFRAGIRPTTPAHKIRPARLRRLVAAVRDTLQDAINAGGSSLRDYAQVDGNAGAFQHDCFVYGRVDEPCHLCGHPIQQLRQAGRSTFYCAHCQR